MDFKLINILAASFALGLAIILLFGCAAPEPYFPAYHATPRPESWVERAFDRSIAFHGQVYQ